ncbi:methylated-DNA--[protein]-cysteine S-methyltransferase [Agromyces aerolatus]|uniref:methylated-DNA--[protein]-cysteine S-methyltransferase n=1 Tax=Agromyces sp. LY-1074 TaxID=3074080 RepID=UPI002858B50E|nr:MULTISPECIES: methylated-DNA--[protein]-cysteine S-methyltransferase [unclassified Agromyces]MDR5701297.1 methylated-DNA--[protein]-cysteine S-methyltransferase [Agromyces sp. LY-1074]MDR5707555.1 methylated-DNA--[protein]-cysteine S-methyltransferase [Agromyces sp. LY-1358]
MSDLFLTRIDSPIGRLEIIGNGEAVTALHIERGGALPHDGEPLRSDLLLDDAAAQLGEYFASERNVFNIPVRVHGTPFQRAVWVELGRLGWGEAVSYGALAAAIGQHGSSRAIGRAVGANPVPIIVGCHRVLGSDGRVTGYSGGEGVPTKLWLLQHEHIGFAA